ncbi:MAG: hypothetical protein KAT65_19990 [Methanophagales archaeon]|nr:hypothetical protein [Methanophagales archaeon]
MTSKKVQSQDGTNVIVYGAFNVESGDEIEVLKARRFPDSLNATLLRNKSKDITFQNLAIPFVMASIPKEEEINLIGFAQEIEIKGSDITKFQLSKTGGGITSKAIKETQKFIDSTLYSSCSGKDYQDVLANAFPILEEKIINKLGLDPNLIGQKLIGHAFNPTTGKLILGNTKAEQEAIYFLFSGAMGYLRNPSAHRRIKGSDEEAFEVMCLVDLLLRHIKKAKPRP